MAPPIPDRDRDPDGRPRNARPRDASGQPLARDAEGVTRIPDDFRPTPDEAITLAQQYLDANTPFLAHEVLEAMWKNSVDPERDLWQGLAQLAVGLTHLQRDNGPGGAALLRRGAENVAKAPGELHYGVDIAATVAWAEELADEVDRFGAPTNTAWTLRSVPSGS